MIQVEKASFFVRKKPEENVSLPPVLQNFGQVYECTIQKHESKCKISISY